MIHSETIVHQIKKLDGFVNQNLTNFNYLFMRICTITSNENQKAHLEKCCRTQDF